MRSTAGWAATLVRVSKSWGVARCCSENIPGLLRLQRTHCPLTSDATPPPPRLTTRRTASIFQYLVGCMPERVSATGQCVLGSKGREDVAFVTLFYPNQVGRRPTSRDRGARVRRSDAPLPHTPLVGRVFVSSFVRAASRDLLMCFPLSLPGWHAMCVCVCPRQVVGHIHVSWVDPHKGNI